MAKATTIKIKLLSTADTGFFTRAKKNSRTQTEKLSYRKYDPVAKQARRIQGSQDQVNGQKSDTIPATGASRWLYILQSAALTRAALVSVE